MTSAHHDAPEPFRIEVEPHRETVVVAAHGEIDIATADAVSRRLYEMMEAGFRRVVLDLRGVSFIDSTGLRAVLDAHSSSGVAEVEFMVIPGPEAVQRLFELTGTAGVLRFVDASAVDRA